MVNLTAQTVRHFIPDATFYCVSFYKKNSDEYKDQEPLLDFIENEFVQTAYVNTSDKPHDHEDSTKTSGYDNKDNAKYFTEGYNAVFKKFKNTDEKILILAEDHFFTTGKTLEEIVSNDFDVAYGSWAFGASDMEEDANGAILGLNFSKIGHLFPLPEDSRGNNIEKHLRVHLISKASQPYRLTTRKHSNYFGDGMYTNSSIEMERLIKQAGII